MPAAFRKIPKSGRDGNKTGTRVGECGVMKMNSSHNGAAATSGAFTLIELLVVISIIALLASVAVPAYQMAVMTAQENAAMQNARQIGMAMRGYANDYGGSYVSGSNTYGQQITTSNDAFRSLIPNYLDSEKIF